MSITTTIALTATATRTPGFYTAPYTNMEYGELMDNYSYMRFVERLLEERAGTYPISGPTVSHRLVIRQQLEIRDGDVKDELKEVWIDAMRNLVVKAEGWRQELWALGAQWKIDYPPM